MKSFSYFFLLLALTTNTFFVKAALPVAPTAFQPICVSQCQTELFMDNHGKTFFTIPNTVNICTPHNPKPFKDIRIYTDQLPTGAEISWEQCLQPQNYGPLTVFVAVGPQDELKLYLNDPLGDADVKAAFLLDNPYYQPQYTEYNNQFFDPQAPYPHVGYPSQQQMYDTAYYPPLTQPYPDMVPMPYFQAPMPAFFAPPHVVYPPALMPYPYVLPTPHCYNHPQVVDNSSQQTQNPDKKIKRQLRLISKKHQEAVDELCKLKEEQTSEKEKSEKEKIEATEKIEMLEKQIQALKAALAVDRTPSLPAIHPHMLSHAPQYPASYSPLSNSMQLALPPAMSNSTHSLTFAVAKTAVSAGQKIQPSAPVCSTVLPVVSTGSSNSTVARPQEAQQKIQKKKQNATCEPQQQKELSHSPKAFENSPIKQIPLTYQQSNSTETPACSVASTAPVPPATTPLCQQTTSDDDDDDADKTSLPLQQPAAAATKTAREREQEKETEQLNIQKKEAEEAQKKKQAPAQPIKKTPEQRKKDREEKEQAAQQEAERLATEKEEARKKALQEKKAAKKAAHQKEKELQAAQDERAREKEKAAQEKRAQIETQYKQYATQGLYEKLAPTPYLSQGELLVLQYGAFHASQIKKYNTPYSETELQQLGTFYKRLEVFACCNTHPLVERQAIFDLLVTTFSLPEYFTEPLFTVAIKLSQQPANDKPCVVTYLLQFIEVVNGIECKGGKTCHHKKVAEWLTKAVKGYPQIKTTYVYHYLQGHAHHDPQQALSMVEEGVKIFPQEILLLDQRMKLKTSIEKSEALQQAQKATLQEQAAQAVKLLEAQQPPLSRPQPVGVEFDKDNANPEIYFEGICLQHKRVMQMTPEKIAQNPRLATIVDAFKATLKKAGALEKLSQVQRLHVLTVLHDKYCTTSEDFEECLRLNYTLRQPNLQLAISCLQQLCNFSLEDAAQQLNALGPEKRRALEAVAEKIRILKTNFSPQAFATLSPEIQQEYQNLLDIERLFPPNQQ